jgi:hypothetical protein
VKTATAFLACAAAFAQSFAPGRRVLLDAHNCYPEKGEWADRIERALAQRTPLAIEQDLLWHAGRSILSHDDKPTGSELGMKEYFFERIRPIVEKALQSGDTRDWPLIVLNLDFKSDEPEHHRAIWKLLEEYEPWLTTARKTEDRQRRAKLEARPLLVLTGASDVQERTFHDAVPAGGKLRLFGAIQTRQNSDADTSVGELITGRPSNYRRWWNNPWSVVEKGGPQAAGEWTKRDRARLRSIVKHGHGLGLWLRFYTLNGHEPAAGHGWTASYNFGSTDSVKVRWREAVEAGVDFVATDQYEEFALVKK